MDAYRLALEQGRKELAEAQGQQRKLSLRISQLEALVTQLQAFISKEESKDTPLFEPLTTVVAAVAPALPENNPAERLPLWRAIINALNGQKADFTVPQALQALERTGRIIESPNRLNIIRNTLIQREDIFGRSATGHYFVRGFERGAKKREEEEKKIDTNW